ncbi:hypothetical protein BEL04_15185 [Mucilaginibacter sp. PPCGB 2223]|uniref:hypothetical protein n=1 Tax=Mucilaginibacter sp. PPCGB 2223 TaxID=1886027 RepID=UPI000824E1B9|nr:hypothetical protein [Mucilaginibacter sp. PPCGB 2223]OCX51373.1 hypothetical protein BEL04_15185 [Mucilaginibacter sp. PPCGB 2223]
MEKFPELKEGQVTLLRADFKTGHVLDELFKEAVKADQEIYTIFDDKDKALQFAKSIIYARKDIECVISGQDGEMIFYVTPQNVASF